MNKKLIIDLSKMQKFVNPSTKREYQGCIYADDNEFYEIQLHKVNFPSTKKRLRELITEGELIPSNDTINQNHN